MNHEQFQKLSELLEIVLREDPVGRSLEKVISKHPEMAADLEELRGLGAQDFRWLDAPLFGLGKWFVDDPADLDNADRQIGPYRIRKKIGEGGMGSVFLATRAYGQSEQKLAIKFLNPSNQLANREKEILASLEHPNITRLIDDGSTDSGWPFLVMEYVDGLPIDQFCDQRALSLQDRLRLFLDVCRAVETAHQRTVVHRDLKPSNILVTEQGTVKLLDFGISKDLQKTKTFENQGTMADWQSPCYASPEQHRRDGVTTLSDIYSLGVLLHRLLTGLLPHDLEKAEPFDVPRIVLQEPLDLPSSAVSREARTDPANLQRIARTRLCKPGSLQSQLKGDLDSILVKALQMAPEDRYPSALAMAEDIERHLKGLPVSAQPPTWWYRSGKFARRHKFGLGVAAALLIVGALFSVSMVHQVDQTRRERDKAQRITDFLVGLFEISNPTEARGREITAREVLSTAAVKIKQELDSEPELRSDLLNVLGEVHRGLGLYSDAEDFFSEALQVRRDLYGSDDLAVAESLNNLAVLRSKAGRLSEAEQLYAESIRIKEKALGSNDPSLGETFHNVAVLLFRQGQYVEAEKSFQKALKIRKQAYGPEHLTVAETLNDLGALNRYLGLHDKAEQYYRESLDIRKGQLPAIDPRVLQSQNGLANLYHDQGRYDEAEPLYKSVLDGRIEVFGKNHDEVAQAYNNLAQLYRDTERFEQAENLYKKAIQIKESVFGEDHSEVAASINNLAQLYHYTARYDESRTLFKRALSTMQRAVGESHAYVATILNNYAQLLEDDGRLEQAEELYREAVVMWEDTLGPEHPHLAATLNNLGVLHMRMGKHDSAQALLERSLTIRRKRLKPDHPLIAATLRNLAEAFHKDGKLGIAERYERQALKAREQRLGENHPEVASALKELAIIVHERGGSAEAVQLLRRAEVICQESLGPDDPLTTSVVKMLNDLIGKSDPSTTAEAHTEQGQK